MSKSQESKTKKIKRGNLRVHICEEPKLRVYNIGVYFPERDPLLFEVTAHGFDIIKGVTNFYCLGHSGIKEFVGSFTYVAYVFLKEHRIPDESCSADNLPKNFGNLL